MAAYPLRDPLIKRLIQRSEIEVSHLFREG
jgi:hypothetical protein